MMPRILVAVAAACFEASEALGRGDVVAAASLLHRAKALLMYAERDSASSTAEKLEAIIRRLPAGGAP